MSEANANSVKMWGKEPFWGLTNDWDQQFHLTESQKKLQAQLIELCRVTLKNNAVVSDEQYIYPRKNFEALASIGLLSVIVPKELGGLGENHMCAAMVVETIARYGCASTAMCYTMHIGAVACLLYRYHNNPKAKDLLSRLDKDVLIGTLSFSDPATGGHFWFPMSSKAWQLDDEFLMMKAASWTTSAGYADWYILQTTSPGFGGNFANLSCFLAFKDEVRANSKEWSALGLRGNQSGPMYVEERLSKDRLVGGVGEGASCNDEIVDPFFLMCSSACWNGLSFGAMDLAKRHVTQKRHADVGLRVCDYPTIQDYFGDCICDTNASRAVTWQLAKRFDDLTNNCDWSKHADFAYTPRTGSLHWGWQTKYTAAKNCCYVVDKMLHACGGAAYKTDLGIERYLRDAKAAWVMGPSNEVVRQFIGKTSLLGMNCLDYWDQRANTRVLHTETKKLDREGKIALAKKLMREAESMGENADEHEAFQKHILENNEKHPNFLTTISHTTLQEKKKQYDLVLENPDTCFINPFNTAAPVCPGAWVDKNGQSHNAALNPNTYSTLTLSQKTSLAEDFACYRFSFPNSNDYSGCVTGQYVRVRVPLKNGKFTTRYFSPASDNFAIGHLELVVRFESEGEVSNFLRNMEVGQTLDFQGNVGGFEYHPNSIDNLVLITSGGGVTPALQILRTLANDPTDKTKVTLLWSVENEQDYLYREELDELAKKHANIDVQVTIKDPSGSWTGREGYLDGDMLAAFLPGKDVESQKLVLCGGPAMTITVLQHLFELGYSSNSIFMYGATADEQIKSVFGRNAPLTLPTLKP